MTLGHRNSLCGYSPNRRRRVVNPDDLNASGEEGHNDCVWKAVFLSKARISICSRDGTLIMWRVEDGKRIHFRGHKGEICKSVTCCAFNPGATQLNGTVDIARGSMMVSASWDKTLLDVETGNVLGELVGHSHYVYCCHFSYDGYLVLSCSHDGTAKLWDVLEATCLKTFNGISEDEDDLPGHDKMVCWCCWRPAQPKLDQQFLTCSADRTLRLWSVKSGKVLLIFEGHEAPVQSCGMTADGKLAISVSWDRTIRIWEANTAQCVASVPQGAGISTGSVRDKRQDGHKNRDTGDHLYLLWRSSGTKINDVRVCAPSPFRPNACALDSIPLHATPFASFWRACSRTGPRSAPSGSCLRGATYPFPIPGSSRPAMRLRGRWQRPIDLAPRCPEELLGRRHHVRRAGGGREAAVRVLHHFDEEVSHALRPRPADAASPSSGARRAPLRTKGRWARRADAGGSVASLRVGPLGAAPPRRRRPGAGGAGERGARYCA